MSLYAQDAAGALADVSTAGTAVTFTRRTQTISETTGLSSESVSTIAGYAIEKSSGESDVYEALSLVRAANPLLLVTPTTFGSEIQVGDEVTWAGATHTVKSVRHIRPDGTPILSFCVVGR